MKADMLILLSDIDGLYTADPHFDPNAKLITKITKIDDDVLALAGVSSTNLGTGGMITKINAAEIANSNGIDMIIVNGKNPDNLYYLFENGNLGTLFKA